MRRQWTGMQIILGIAVLLAMCATLWATEPNGCPVQRDGVFVISPLIGRNRNELKLPARGPMVPPMTLTDTETEYGLYAMYANPRLVVNNMFFYTDPNDADVYGNLLFVNLYGAPDHDVRWNVGAGYLWHEIQTPGPTIAVNAPMAKAGLVWRLPALHLSLNPYVGYVWEEVEIGGSSENTEAWLYGVTGKWQWRMVHATAKYYLQDDQDRDEQYNVVRLRIMGFLNERSGVMARFEYMEHSTSDDTSVLVGPIVLF